MEGSATARALLAGLAKRKPAGDAAEQQASPAADPEPEPAPEPAPAPPVAQTVAIPAQPSAPAAAPLPEEQAPEQIEQDDAEAELETAAPWDGGSDADDALPAYAMADDAALAEPVAYQFDGDWGTLVGLLGSRLGAARMLAHNAVLKNWSQSRLELAVPDSFRHMATRDYQEKLKAALSEQFGQPVELVVTIEELGLETPAMQGARHRQEQLAQARLCLENDPVIQQLVREMGATLVAETIQPLQEL